MGSQSIEMPIGRAFLLEPFADFLSLERSAAPLTCEAYGRDVTRFATYAATHGADAPAAIGMRLVRDYVYHLKDLGLAPASIRRNVSAVRTYYRFLLADGHVVRDPTERLEMPNRWRSLPEVLSVEEVQRLLAAPTLDEPLAFRDRALLELAYGAGLRVSEWITLGVRDVVLAEALVRVVGKGNKERLVPIGRPAIGAVAVYLRELRPRLERGGGRGMLLLNARGEPLTRMGAWKVLRKYVVAGGHHQARDTAHPATFVRDAPPRGRRRPAGSARHAGPRRHFDDADLHARRPRVSAQRPPPVPPARLR